MRSTTTNYVYRTENVHWNWGENCLQNRCCYDSKTQELREIVHRHMKGINLEIKSLKNLENESQWIIATIVFNLTFLFHWISEINNYFRREFRVFTSNLSSLKKEKNRNLKTISSYGMNVENKIANLLVHAPFTSSFHRRFVDKWSMSFGNFLKNCYKTIERPKWSTCSDLLVALNRKWHRNPVSKGSDWPKLT